MENGGAGTGVGGGAPGGPGDTGAGQGPDSEGGGHESSGNYAEAVSHAISADISNAKSANPAQTARDKDPENFDPMGSSHIGQFGYYGGVDASGQPTGTQPTHSTMGHTLVGDAMRAKDQTITGIGTNFTDAQYKDKGWVPGKALTYTDEDGITQLARLESHDQSISQSRYEEMRDQAYAAKAAQTGIDTPFGKMTAETVAKAAFGMISPAAGVGGMVSGLLDSIGLPDIGPFMSPDNRNWSDARWAEDFDPAAQTTKSNINEAASIRSAEIASGSPISVYSGSPTSPAGGEQITVAAPPGAPDQRVTQFKALYPAEWTETLTDEEILEMIENPDQLRFWLSWRQT